MTRSRRCFLAAALGGFACRRKRGSGFEGYAFVANEEGQSVAVVDLSVFAVVRHIRLDSRPTDVLSDPARSGVFLLSAHSGTLYEIRGDSLTLGRRARIAPRALSPKFHPAADSLWLLAPETRQLVRVSLETFRADARVALPGIPAELDVSGDGEYAAASLPAEKAIVLVRLARPAVVRSIPAGPAPSLLRFRNDGRQLLVAHREAKLLSIHEIPSGRLIVRLPLAVEPRHFCFKQDGGQLFITGEGLDAVVTVYPFETEVGATTLAGRTPGFLAVSSTPNYLFVANPSSGDVTIVNIDTQRVIAVAAVGKEPGAIVVTPDNQYALVLNRGSGDVAVLRIGAITSSRTRSAPLFTMIPVGSRPVGAVVRGV